MLGPSSAGCAAPRRVRIYNLHSHTVGQVTVKGRQLVKPGNPLSQRVVLQYRHLVRPNQGGKGKGEVFARGVVSRHEVEEGMRFSLSEDSRTCRRR